MSMLSASVPDGGLGRSLAGCPGQPAQRRNRRHDGPPPFCPREVWVLRIAEV